MNIGNRTGMGAIWGWHTTPRKGKWEEGGPKGTSSHELHCMAFYFESITSAEVKLLRRILRITFLSHSKMLP